jgi:hypothetical protein
MRFIPLILGTVTFLSVARAFAACNGCTPEQYPEQSLVCSATCDVKGYRVSVLRTGPDLPVPDGCSGSASGQYLLLESVSIVQNFAPQNYAAFLAGPYHPDQSAISLVISHPPANALVCDANGNNLSGTIYTATIIHNGPSGCVPAREGKLDCGNAGLMAHVFNTRLPATNLPTCPSCQPTPNAGGAGPSSDGVIWGPGSIDWTWWPKDVERNLPSVRKSPGK